MGPTNNVKLQAEKALKYYPCSIVSAGSAGNKSNYMVSLVLCFNFGDDSIRIIAFCHWLSGNYWFQ